MIIKKKNIKISLLKDYNIKNKDLKDQEHNHRMILKVVDHLEAKIIYRIYILKVNKKKIKK